MPGKGLLGTELIVEISFQPCEDPSPNPSPVAACPVHLSERQALRELLLLQLRKQSILIMMIEL